MDFNWPVVSVDDIKAPTKSSISIGPFGSRMKSDCYVDDGIPVIRGNNLSHSKSFVGDFVYISPEKADELASSNVFAGDLVFPHRGNIGEVGIVPADKPRYILSTSLMKLTVDQKKVDPLFLFYFFRSTKGRYELLKNASQVGTPGIATPLTSLKSIQLKLPSLSEQRAIAHIIGTLDDKIELNHQINQTLEAIAQAIFKSWFVDFEPVKAKIAAFEAGEDAEDVTRAAMSAISGKTCEELDQLQAEQPDNYTQLKTTAELFPASMQDSELGEIPKGWEVKKVNEILELAYGKPLKEDVRLPGNIPVYGSNGQIGWHNQKLVDGPGIVVGRKGNPGTVTWVHMHFYPIDTTFYVIPKGSVKSLYYLLYALKKQDLPSLAADSAVPGLNRNIVYMNKIIVPHISTLDLFDVYLNNIHQKIQVNKEQSRVLGSIRDFILPKLLSGELSVEAAKLAEEEG